MATTRRSPLCHLRPAARGLPVVLLGGLWLLGLGAACAASRASADTLPGAYDARFRDLHGKVVTLEQFAGRVVVVHVFATWDMTSLRSVPDLNRLVKDRDGAAAVVGVGVDQGGANMLVPFVRAMHPTYPVWLPDTAFMAGKTVFGPPRDIPRFFILNRSGRMVGGYSGYIPYPDLARLVDEAAR